MGSTRLEARIGHLGVRWVRTVARRRGLAALGCAILFTAALGLSVTRLGIQSDKNALFPEDLPFRVIDARYVEAFPSLAENVVLVLEGERAGPVREAARALSARLEADSEHFEDVYRPAGPFFEVHGLLFLEQDELDEIVDRLALLQPMLAAVVRDPSLPGLLEPLRRAFGALRQGEVEELALAPVVERIAGTLRAAELGEPGAAMDWSEILRWRDGQADLRRELIHVRPHVDFGSMAAAEDAVEALFAHASALGIGSDERVRLRMTGDPILNFEEMRLLGGQVALAGLASFAVVAGLLFAALQSGRLVSATVASLLCGLVWTAGFATLAIGHLNMISVAFAVLFIGLGVDFGIHLCMRFQELARAGHGRRAALEEAVRGVGSSLFLCAITTAIGFLAFVPTDFLGVAELGVIAGFGMFIGLFASLTVIPIVVSGTGRETSAGRGGRTFLLPPRWPARFPRAVLVAALLLSLPALGALPRLRFDSNPLAVRDPGADSVRVFEELLAERDESPWTLNDMVASEADARRAKAAYEALAEVEGARTIWDFVPEDQAARMASIEEMSLFVDLGAWPSEPPRSSVDETRRELEALRAEIRKSLPVLGDRELARAASALGERLERLSGTLDEDSPEAARARLDELERRLLERFRDPLERLERALGAEPFGIEDLPGPLRDRMISPEGLYRIEILAAEDLTREGALDRFVTAVQGVSNEVGGPALRIRDSARAVVEALRQAFLSAGVTIVVILTLLWRRLADVLLVVLPLGWAGAMTGGAMVALGLDFNFADVIVLPLLLGIGVDSGIHMVHRARIGGRAGETLLATSTPRAVAFSALTTIASFGSLALVPHLGMASLGQLLVVGVSFTVVANLVVLPALLAASGRAGARR